VSYGTAIASATERATSADRAYQHANYLAGIKKANQDYELGIGSLGVSRANVDLDTQKLSQSAQNDANQLAISKRQLDQEEAKIGLAKNKLALDKQVAQKSASVSWINAASNFLT
jgi:hypothetical protein